MFVSVLFLATALHGAPTGPVAPPLISAVIADAVLSQPHSPIPMPNSRLTQIPTAQRAQPAAPALQVPTSGIPRLPVANAAGLAAAPARPIAPVTAGNAAGITLQSGIAPSRLPNVRVARATQESPGFLPPSDFLPNAAAVRIDSAQPATMGREPLISAPEMVTASSLPRAGSVNSMPATPDSIGFRSAAGSPLARAESRGSAPPSPATLSPFSRDGSSGSLPAANVLGAAASGAPTFARVMTPSPIAAGLAPRSRAAPITIADGFSSNAPPGQPDFIAGPASSPTIHLASSLAAPVLPAAGARAAAIPASPAAGVHAAHVVPASGLAGLASQAPITVVRAASPAAPLAAGSGANAPASFVAQAPALPRGWGGWINSIFGRIPARPDTAVVASSPPRSAAGSAPVTPVVVPAPRAAVIPDVVSQVGSPRAAAIPDVVSQVGSPRAAAIPDVVSQVGSPRAAVIPNVVSPAGSSRAAVIPDLSPPVAAAGSSRPAAFPDVASPAAVAFGRAAAAPATARADGSSRAAVISDVASPGAAAGSPRAAVIPNVVSPAGSPRAAVIPDLSPPVAAAGSSRPAAFPDVASPAAVAFGRAAAAPATGRAASPADAPVIAPLGTDIPAAAPPAAGVRTAQPQAQAPLPQDGNPAGTPSASGATRTPVGENGGVANPPPANQNGENSDAGAIDTVKEKKPFLSTTAGQVTLFGGVSLASVIPGVALAYYQGKKGLQQAKEQGDAQLDLQRQQIEDSKVTVSPVPVSPGPDPSVDAQGIPLLP